MKISVVICTLNNINQLNSLFQSISVQSLKPYEIIVVHGEKDLFTKDLCSSWSNTLLNIRYIQAERSLIVQRNVGLELSNGEIICYLDDDVILEQNYFKPILDTYLSDESIAGVQGTCSNEILQSWFKTFYIKLFLLDDMNGNGKLKKSGLPSFHKKSKFPVEVEVFNGFQMTYRKNVLQINKFDLELKKHWWGDDFITSYLISRNYKLIQIPESKLFHHGNASFSKSPNLAFMRGRNLTYLRKNLIVPSFFSKILFLWSDFGQIIIYFWLMLEKGGVEHLKNWFLGKILYKNENITNK